MNMWVAFLTVPFIFLGKGTQIWKKAGAIYDGDWKYGKRDGYGTYSKLLSVTNEYSREYSGGWENDKKHVCTQDNVLLG
jgi:hypothetical protein